ncbi:MAG: cysteine desulfurase family protein, partial [Candidatus Gracilibacteria bacterium]|nr:cysteine desulfurase family protein [Candidatus Gracilibacteria bacterium]
MNAKKNIYLDYAATTPVDPEVLRSMLPYFTEKFGNAGSLHSKGLEAKQAIDQARATIAKYLNCQPSEIIFTGSGTEGNNIAIIGTAKANKSKGHHLITSKIEHPSVLDVFKQLEKEGFVVTYLDVNEEGFIDLTQLENAITKETILVSIMFANNEIGSIEPVEEIAKICKKHKVLFHTDACQIAEYKNIDTKSIPLDLLTINGSKIYGPKGIALLYVRKGTPIYPLFQGGSQEQGLRAGTENTPEIVGLAKAFEIAQKNCKEESARTEKLRDYFIENILKKIPNARLNGP